jgi:hypothetical protein
MRQRLFFGSRRMLIGDCLLSICHVQGSHNVSLWFRCYAISPVLLTVLLPSYTSDGFPTKDIIYHSIPVQYVCR